jgi:SAM-dependent methyltransferase
MTTPGGPQVDVETLDEANDLDSCWWRCRQESYWDAIADRYDQLYTSRWSKQENRWVEHQLSFISGLAAPTVLDLGCGTGLGLKMVRRLNKFAQYIGIDVSERMVRALTKADSAAKICVGSMDDLGFVESEQVDVVISLFSSVSYAYNSEAVFSEIGRVLAPGGYAYLSVLSSRGLSQLRGGIRHGLYRTRGDHQSGMAAPVRRHTTAGIDELCEASGLTVERATGMNIFSGLAEVPALWHAGRLVARWVPDWAHTIEVLLRKKA